MPPPWYSGPAIDLGRVGGQGGSLGYGGTDAPQFDDVMHGVDGIDRQYVTSATVPPCIVVRLDYYLISGKITSMEFSLVSSTRRAIGIGGWGIGCTNTRYFEEVTRSRGQRRRLGVNHGEQLSIDRPIYRMQSGLEAR